MDFQKTETEVASKPAPGQKHLISGKERVLCLDAKSGQTIWEFVYDCPYGITYPGGPRCTPTVVDGKVYALGAEGNLNCLDANSGKLLWGKELKKEYNCESPVWGFAGHPLVEGDTLYCHVGGKGSIAVALDRHSGKEIWRSIDEKDPGYSPPTLIEV